MEDVWPQLSRNTRAWLIDHNGETVPAEIVSEIERLAGPLASQPVWGEPLSDGGFALADEVTDWVEQTANEES